MVLFQFTKVAEIKKRELVPSHHHPPVSTSPASEYPRWSGRRVLQTLNEPTESHDLIFYSALFITCMPLFHKGTEKERERVSKSEEDDC